ncbi:MAG TPA: aquaporin [Verrucomicrobiae bacterium]|nr:aquaporin [Verrucomicrobiae bacterium]
MVRCASAHGLTMAMTVSATGGILGRHLDPAVTFDLLVGGKIDFKGAIRHRISQAGGCQARSYC